jgi:gliding motility-associated-like protein
VRIAGVIAGILFIIGSAQAQFTSRLGRFQLDNIRGCAPLTVNITNANLVTTGECTSGKPCVMDYGGQPCPPASCQNLFTYTFTTAGTYKLTVTYQNIGADDITITVDPDTQPAFDIYSCAGSQVEINITDKTYDSYTIDFNSDGVIDNTIPSGTNQLVTHSYGTPGNYNIRVKGKKVSAANNCSAKVLPFTALNVMPAPVFKTLDALSTDTLKLGFTPQTNIQYQVEFATNATSNFQTYKNLYGVNTLTVPNLNVDQNYYCFRLNSHDPCANTNVASIPVCSQIFGAVAVSGANQLTWQTAGNPSTISVQRDGASYASMAGTATSYNDLTVTCQTKYCYRLKATYSNGAISSSLQKCVTAFLTAVPPAIDNASTVVKGTQLQMTWKDNPVFPTSSYAITKSFNGSSYFTYGTSATPDFTDSSYDTNYPTCYEINFTDNCGNTSAAGKPICPIRLAGTLDEKNDITIRWNKYTGWTQGVKEYTVQKFNAAGSLIKTFTTTDTTFNDNTTDLINQVVYYKILATPIEFGFVQSVSNELKMEKRINLFAPTAFNPESQHKENTTFTVRGHYISNMELRIFDRWGTLVFDSNDNGAWDGRKEGTAMPTATYVWTAQGTDFAGNTFKEAGTVVLIRHKN